MKSGYEVNEISIPIGGEYFCLDNKEHKDKLHSVLSLHFSGSIEVNSNTSVFPDIIKLRLNNDNEEMRFIGIGGIFLDRRKAIIYIYPSLYLYEATPYEDMLFWRINNIGWVTSNSVDVSKDYRLRVNKIHNYDFTMQYVLATGAGHFPIYKTEEFGELTFFRGYYEEDLIDKANKLPIELDFVDKNKIASFIKMNEQLSFCEFELLKRELVNWDDISW